MARMHLRIIGKRAGKTWRRPRKQGILRDEGLETRRRTDHSKGASHVTT
jgi:hypothetical protein